MSLINLPAVMLMSLTLPRMFTVYSPRAKHYSLGFTSLNSFHPHTGAYRLASGHTAKGNGARPRTREVRLQTDRLLHAGQLPASSQEDNAKFSHREALCTAAELKHGLN